ncbi:MAG TPA: 30S ribosome-binding factor RbfA [Candidatus Fimadaptatus faecigallinarum]|uniref:Ribosome-binding factor A n=1 Tax=Candidatus Fimadaptatus faecigallinarum TaxID=2840814 RepID=A0A9D1LRU3_9FIRM|nr:30S ribosome-binding factor RbfA [Candidatus Fimadaptatus faecigallinarum]
MAYNRIDRISEEVRRELDKLLREDMRDPRLAGTFSITRAEVTRDLRYCKVHVSVLEQDKRAGVMEALKSAAGFLRRELGRRVDLRYTPELIFELDTNIEYASYMTKLIDEAVKRDAARSDDTQ